MCDCTMCQIMIEDDHQYFLKTKGLTLLKDFGHLTEAYVVFKVNTEPTQPIVELFLGIWNVQCQ